MKNPIFTSAIILVLLTVFLGGNSIQAANHLTSQVESEDTLSSSPIILECNYASSDNKRQPMHYHWSISNRISPIGKFNSLGEGALYNVVRPLGGKSKNGEKAMDEDTYKWDGEKYYYDWVPLKKQIDNVGPANLYQLVTDNPSWAFQRGMEIADDSKVETYGNPWPPNDPKAWSDYIKAMLQELINTYGKAQVEQWRYCIGREIGTPGHWRAGQLAFFEHYKNTLDAIKSVLPNAKVGTHFLWSSSKHSYGPDFVKWCKQNNTHYDFIGVSYYPFYNQIKRVDPDYVYKIDFAPIKDIPEWNPAATLEFHEFALITSMNAKGNGFENASKPYLESFTVLMAKMMYEHDMKDVFRWGSDENKLAEQTFLTMEGNIYYTSSKQGAPQALGNMVDAVFAQDPATKQYNIMAYNYNANPDSKNTEPVTIAATIPLRKGSKIKYRSASYSQNGLEWSEWKTYKTTAGKKSSESIISIQSEIPVFSFAKYEIVTEKKMRK